MCTFRHMYNKRQLFGSMCTKSIDFIALTGHIIWIENISTGSIYLLNNAIIEFYNIALVSSYDSNLILSK